MSTASIQHVKFSHPFLLPGHTVAFQPGSYRVLVEDEQLHGVNFEALRRVSTHLLVEGAGPHPGRSALYATTDQDLATASARDRALAERKTLILETRRT